MMEVDYFKQGATKRCVFGTCKSDSRCVDTPFLSFPKPCLAVRKQLENGDNKHIKQCSLCAKSVLWLSKCRRQNFSKLTHVKKWHYICVLHFVNAVGPTTENPFPLTAAEASLRRIKQSNNTRRKQTTSVSHPTTTEIVHKKVVIDSSPMSVSDPLSERSSHLLPLVDVCSKSTQTSTSFQSISNLENQNKMLKGKLDAFKKELQHLRKLKPENARLKLENKKLKEHNEKLTKIRLQKNKKNDSFENITNFVNSLQKSDRKCKFYTGLTFTNILSLLSFLSPVDKLCYWGSSKSSTCNINKKKLSHLEELIMVLVRLRTGLLIEDMHYRFNISTGYITKIVITWVQHSYLKFNVIRPLMLPSREKIKKHLPAIFKNLKNIKIIIDCAEFSCESPSHFEQQGNLYSSYKATTTFKVLLGCTPNGAVSFVSELFEGSISDKELVEKSKLIDLLEEGDLVLADRGFTISDLTSKANVSLNIPPFLKGRDHLTAEEEIATKQIAKQRIYIEHVVGKVKQFRLLKKRLPLNMRGILSQIVFVCSCLVNFQEPIVKS